MKALKHTFKTEKSDFNSQMLGVGEMMELDNETTLYSGIILLRTFDGFVSLNNPNATWCNSATLTGRKLLSGEGVTLIQE